MTVLNFTLQPTSCARLHDALTCLSRFSEYVSLEAKHGQVLLTALNSSKSAYASFRFDDAPFFHVFDFVPDDRSRTDRFSCRILNKALLSVFKSRMVDSKGGNPNFERAEVNLLDRPDRAECRLVIKLFNRHGVTKTYKLTYEPVEMMHALFDKARANNHFRIHSGLLRGYIEFFGVKTEQLNICRENETVTMTSYTEKIVYGKEILKQPLQTAITIDSRDFEELDIEELVHIGINVKDFKNIVLHAETLRTSVLALYSIPGRPLQFSYSGDGMHCEYTLMTIGDARTVSEAAAAAAAPVRPPIRQPYSRPESVNRSRDASAMPPPAQATSFTSSRTSRQLGSRRDLPAQATMEDDASLFVPQDEDDRRWDPLDDGDDEQDTLGWDASADNDVPFQGSAFQNTAPSLRTEAAAKQLSRKQSDYIAPTQRASQVRGLFD